MKKLLVLALAVLTVAGCVTLHQGGAPVSLAKQWVILPFINNTETPYAAERAESITAALMHARGVQRLERLKVDEAKPEERLLSDRGEQRQKAALEQARQRKADYALAGTVNEWRYKVGLDGEPTAAFTLQVIELPGGQVVWSGTVGKSGWSRDAVSSVAQQALDTLLGSMSVTRD